MLLKQCSIEYLVLVSLQTGIQLYRDIKQLFNFASDKIGFHPIIQMNNNCNNNKLISSV